MIQYFQLYVDCPVILDNNVAIITGVAEDGIGQAMARVPAREGATVVGCGVSYIPEVNQTIDITT